MVIGQVERALSKKKKITNFIRTKLFAGWDMFVYPWNNELLCWSATNKLGFFVIFIDINWEQRTVSVDDQTFLSTLQLSFPTTVSLEISDLIFLCSINLLKNHFSLKVYLLFSFHVTNHVSGRNSYSIFISQCPSPLRDNLLEWISLYHC